MEGVSKVARRYAQSLLDFSLERKELDAVAADMRLISATIKDNKALYLMLKSPIIEPQQKQRILNKIFSGEIGSASLQFLTVLARKSREELIPEISAAFQSLYLEHKGVVNAVIVTASPLDAELRAKAEELAKRHGDAISLTEKIDPKILGGFILKIGDRQYDASVQNRLAELKKNILHTQN